MLALSKVCLLPSLNLWLCHFSLRHGAELLWNNFSHLTKIRDLGRVGGVVGIPPGSELSQMVWEEFFLWYAKKGQRQEGWSHCAPEAFILSPKRAPSRVEKVKDWKSQKCFSPTSVAGCTLEQQDTHFLP